jgi:hypothetical protein
MGKEHYTRFFLRLRVALPMPALCSLAPFSAIVGRRLFDVEAIVPEFWHEAAFAPLLQPRPMKGYTSFIRLIAPPADAIAVSAMYQGYPLRPSRSREKPERSFAYPSVG